MAYKIFNIAIPNNGEEEQELNQFLLQHRVVAIHRQWVDSGNTPYLVFVVEYVQGKVKDTAFTTPNPREAHTGVDYQKLLTPEQFARYCTLREERKRIADAENVKAFVVFSNAQLAAIAQLEQLSLETLKKVEGVGSERVKRYGERMIACLEKPSEPALTEKPQEELFT